MRGHHLLDLTDDPVLNFDVQRVGGARPDPCLRLAIQGERQDEQITLILTAGQAEALLLLLEREIREKGKG